MRMSIQKLLAIASDPIWEKPKTFPGFLSSYALGAELYEMLTVKNGFYAFESALHVFPITTEPGTGLEGWNSNSLWRKSYGNLTDGLLFFAEDIFQDQFCLSTADSKVCRFNSETGEVKEIGDSLDAWAHSILENHRFLTGWPFVRQWVEKHGPIRAGKRLMPITPFFLGGEYSLENFRLESGLDGMFAKGDLATQTRDLPEGSQIRLRIAKPNQTD